MPTKDDTLRGNGSFNPYHSKVSAEIFRGSQFFSDRDIVQVKYEMLRAVAVDNGSVTEVSAKFGFSRKAYYQISAAFEEGGLPALMPRKHGPKGASKLKGDAADFLDSYASSHRGAKAPEIAARLESELGVRAHPRSIERYYEKKTAQPGKR